MKDLLDSFIEERRTQNTGRNRLIPFKAEIEYLRGKGMGYQDIVVFLKSQKVEVTPQAVGHFCRTHLEKTKATKKTESLQTNKDIKADPATNPSSSKPELTTLEKHKLRLEQEKRQSTPVVATPQKQISSEPTPKKSSTGYIPPSWNADFDLDAALGITPEDDEND